jgi:hypothetical protein
MPRSIALAAAALVAALAPAPGASTPPAPANQQTHPTVSPRVGNAKTRFALRLTVRRTLGVQGGLRYYYAIEVRGPRPRCALVGQIDGGRAGQRLRQAIAPPRRGWCRGRFHGVILLQGGPYCPPPVAGQPPVACPQFALAPIDAGHFRFRVV